MKNLFRTFLVMLAAAVVLPLAGCGLPVYAIQKLTEKQKVKEQTPVSSSSTNAKTPTYTNDSGFAKCYVNGSVVLLGKNIGKTSCVEMGGQSEPPLPSPKPSLAVSSSQNAPSTDPKLLDAVDVCRYSTYFNGQRYEWEKSGAYSKHSREAKRRGFTLENCIGLVSRPTMTQVSEPSSNTSYISTQDAADVEICKLATDSDGWQWLNNVSGYQYVREAQRRGLTLYRCRHLKRGNATQTVQIKIKPTITPAQATDTTPPSIQIASSINVQEDSPTISGKVTDANKVVQVTVNGAASKFSGNTFSFTRYVPASGTTVQIEAVDEWGNRSQKTIRLTRSAIQNVAVTFDALNPTGFSSKPNKDAVALIIGVANYKRVTDAQYADRDAEFFSDYARRKLGVPEANIKVLTNDGADFTSIIEAANVWLPKATKANRSDVYLFFAGHGLGSDDGNELYLLPTGGVPKLLDRTSILRSDLFKSIADAKPRSVTAFLDTCYSGTSRTEETLLASRPILLKSKRQDVPAGFTLISAAGMDQTAKLLPEAEHGLFSYWLMKGMEGPADGNNDRAITAGELHTYVLGQVSRLQHNQTPELQGDAERVLVRW